MSERGLCQFVAFLAGEGLTHGSIKAYLAGVRQMQVEAVLGDPGLGAMAKLGQVVRGVQRLRAEQGVKQKPMTVEVLEVLRTSWSAMPGGVDAKMLWAAATLSSRQWGGVQPRGPPRLAGRGHRQRGEPDHSESSIVIHSTKELRVTRR